MYRNKIVWWIDTLYLFIIMLDERTQRGRFAYFSIIEKFYILQFIKLQNTFTPKARPIKIFLSSTSEWPFPSQFPQVEITPSTLKFTIMARNKLRPPLMSPQQNLHQALYVYMLWSIKHYSLSMHSFLKGMEALRNIFVMLKIDTCMLNRTFELSFVSLLSEMAPFWFSFCKNGSFTFCIFITRKLLLQYVGKCL